MFPGSQVRIAGAALPLACLLLCGCWGKKQPVENEKPKAKSSGVVRVLVVEDAPLAEAIEREWKARAEEEIEVKSTTSAEFVALRKLATDAVVYPAGLLGELVERELIVPVPEDILNDTKFDRRDLLPLARHEISWGGQVYAVPLGSPQLTLLYRADLFERLGLSPPATWAEYQTVIAKLADREQLGDLAPPEDAPWHGVCEPLGPEWGSQTLLARAAGYARHPDQYSTLFDMKTMEPLIAGPPFVKALAELAAAAKLCSAEAGKFSPHDARREFLAGRCGLALCWPTGSRAEAKVESANANEGKATPPAAFAELPGASEVYNVPDGKWTPRRGEDERRVPLLAGAGRLGSVAKDSRRQRQAFQLLAWLSGAESSGQVASQSRDTTLFRTSHLASAGTWTDAGLDPQGVGQYAKLVGQSQERPLWLFSVRIPGRARYLAALDQAVTQTISGEKTPEEALTEAAETWRGITAELGVEPQRLAYRRSLGLDL